MAVFYDLLRILHGLLIYYAKITGIHPVSLVKWLGGRTGNQEVLSSYPIQDFKKIYTFAKFLHFFKFFLKNLSKKNLPLLKPILVQKSLKSDENGLRYSHLKSSNFDLDHPVSRGKELLVHEKDSV